MPGIAIVIAGNQVMPKLTDDDGRTVDLLLDDPTESRTPNDPVRPSAPARFQQRLGRIEQILNLLQVMPPVDLPKGLLRKLMDSIDEPNASSSSSLAATESESSAPSQPYL
jgi:hypothetical protein